MAVARVAYWKFKPGQRDRGKRIRDEMGDMLSFPGVLGAIWLDSTEDPDGSLSFVIFESREALEANGKDPRFREGLKPMAEVVERLPPELHVYDVDFARLRQDLEKAA
jgi:heme-degrading monooxygenase HmoA